MPQWSTVTATPPADHRRESGLTYPDGSKYSVKSCQANWSWGSEPAECSIIYVGSDSPIVTGMGLQMEIAGHAFYGVARADEKTVSTQGIWRSITFKDNRDWLDWDLCYGAFNIVDDKIIGGNRVRRFKHLFPWNYNSKAWTYTQSALTSAQVLNYIFTAPTTQDSWVRVYHPDQVQVDGLGRPFYPVLNIDSLNGKKLRALITEISEAQGLVFTLMGGPFRLVWCRKGEGPDPVIPESTNNRSLGLSLSGNPSRIRVLGDDNLYQVHDIEMVPDWSPPWQQFYDFNVFAQAIFDVGRLKTGYSIRGVQFPAGTQFSDPAIAQIDPEQTIARHLALAYAKEITVREFADLVGFTSFYDTRKFAGRSRMDMPAALYIQQVLFRAFRFPPGFAIRNVQDGLVPAESLSIGTKMVAAVSHDPISGLMDWDLNRNPDGNGYGIIQGYRVGVDLFKTLKPDRFKLEEWNSAQNVWQHVTFQVDDCGEPAGGFILFDEPVIRISDLVLLINGYAVFKANPTITVPPVRVALPLLAERFSLVVGNGTRDDVENVSGLIGEFVSRQGWLPAEVPFLDGLYASQKAYRMANALLSRQFAYLKGSYTRYPVANDDGTWPSGTQLSPKIDRVFISMGTDGCREVVDLTSERPRNTYIPERDLDRGQRLRELFPGQEALIQEANALRVIAAGIKQSPQLAKTLSNAFYGFFGSENPSHQVLVYGGSAPLAVGTPMFGLPSTQTEGGERQNTVVAHPSVVTTDHKHFHGIVTRDGELVDGYVHLARSGEMLARVMGPVAFGAAVGLAAGKDYLVASSTVPCARALESLGTTADGLPRLVKITTDNHAQETGGLTELLVIGEEDDYLRCGDKDGNTDIFVAKPSSLRSGQWNPGWQVSDGTHPAGTNLEVGLRYISKNRRWRVITSNWGSGNLQQADLLNKFMRQLDVSSDPAPINSVYAVGDYKASKETISPPYPANLPIDSSAWGGTHLHTIYASKMTEPLGYTNAEDGTRPIYLLDINADGRHWAPEAIQNLNLEMVNGRAVVSHGLDLGFQSSDPPPF